MNIDALTFFEYERLQEPYLKFYLRRKYVNPRTGLSRAGPYDADLHKSDVIYIGLIAEANITPQAKKFVEHLKSGCSYYKGFRTVFKVDSLVLSDEFIREIGRESNKDDVLPDVENAYLELAEKLPDKSIVIIALGDEVVDKSYARIKALRFKYTRKTVRLQLIRRSTLEKALSNLETLDFTLFNVASAIYAKAGGVPWVLDQRLIPAGVFVGIAFTRPKVIRTTDQTKEIFYYGILTVYNKFGRYIDMTARGIRIEVSKKLKIRGTRGLYIPRDDMVNMLKQIISTYKPPVVIIHKSARFHLDEVNAVKDVLDGRDISYALIHIESSNPYRGYGEEGLNETAVRGDLILDKELGNRAILFTTGCVQSDDGLRKRGKPGTPRPLELEVETNTTPYNIKDFAKQVLGLTKLDWNTTELEVRMPITIKYARKVAALTPHLASTITDVRDLM